MNDSSPSQSDKVKTFRSLHERDQSFLIPNPWDIGSARILQNIGFEALATTSSGLAWSLGRNDGSLSQVAVLDHCRALVSGTNIPVTADLGIGFGVSPEAVAKTISLAAETGLAGCSIEDASTVDGKIMERSLAVERICAAVEAVKALDHDFVLTARADGFAYGDRDINETLTRLIEFEAAGADVLYAPGIVDIELIRVLCRGLTKPVNVLTGFKGMDITYDELSDAGVKRVSVGNQLAKIAYGALVQSAQELIKTKSITQTDIDIRSSRIGKMTN